MYTGPVEEDGRAVGGQCAWFLRPWYGWSFETYPFMLGSSPGYMGAASFFEEVYLHLASR